MASTADNVLAAITMEQEASARYTEFAEAARGEENMAAADLFDELARVKQLHADILKANEDNGGACSSGGCGSCDTGCSS